MFQYVPKQVETGFKNDLEEFSTLFNGLRKLLNGTDYEFLNNVEDTFNHLEILGDIIQANSSLNQILAKIGVLNFDFSSKFTMTDSSKSYHTLIDPNIASKSINPFLQEFDKLSDKTHDLDSNEILAQIVNKIDQDHAKMDSHVLWKSSHHILDEE